MLYRPSRPLQLTWFSSYYASSSLGSHLKYRVLLSLASPVSGVSYALPSVELFPLSGMRSHREGAKPTYLFLVWPGRLWWWCSATSGMDPLGFGFDTYVFLPFASLPFPLPLALLCWLLSAWRYLRDCCMVWTQLQAGSAGCIIRLPTL